MTSVTLQQNQLCIVGRIDFANAQQIYQQGSQLLKQHSDFPIMLDLSGLEQGNTLALAIFIQWLRACPNHDSLKLKNVPNKMLGIIHASHLEHLVA